MSGDTAIMLLKMLAVIVVGFCVTCALFEIGWLEP